MSVGIPLNARPIPILFPVPFPFCHKSSDGPAKQEHVSGQGPRLEGTLVDQAIEQECSLAQWEKLLREESSRGNDQ